MQIVSVIGQRLLSMTRPLLCLCAGSLLAACAINQDYRGRPGPCSGVDFGPIEEGDPARLEAAVDEIREGVRVVWDEWVLAPEDTLRLDFGPTGPVYWVRGATEIGDECVSDGVYGAIDLPEGVLQIDRFGQSIEGLKLALIEGEQDPEPMVPASYVMIGMPADTHEEIADLLGVSEFQIVTIWSVDELSVRVDFQNDQGVADSVMLARCEDAWQCVRWGE